MKIKFLFFLFATCASLTGLAQVKVGDNPSSINSNAVLDVESTTKGILIPRLALTSSGSAAPLSAHVAGMFVFNTATAGDVIPGLYYNDGGKWQQVVYGPRQGFGATLVGGGQTLPNGGLATKVQFGAEEWDNGNVFTPGVATSTFTVQVAGKYILTGSINTSSVAGSTTRALHIYKNNTFLVAGDGTSVGSNTAYAMTVSYIANLAVGDVIDLRAVVNGSASITVPSASFSAIKAD